VRAAQGIHQRILLQMGLILYLALLHLQVVVEAELHRPEQVQLAVQEAAVLHGTLVQEVRVHQVKAMLEALARLT
jgi:hypothetical protein